MTVTGGRVDAGRIRRDYLDGLNAVADARAMELRRPLLEHLRLLVGVVEALVPAMDARGREQAEQCLMRAGETLKRSCVPGGAVAYTYDLAVSARALLALYRHSGSPA